MLITGTNNPQGIGATTALAFAREGAKVVMVYKRVCRPFDPSKTAHNGVDRYYHANAGGTDEVEAELKKLGADYLVMESDIADEAAVEAIYTAAMERYGKVDILVNNAATDDENGLDTIEHITRQVIDDTFAVNVRGSILMMHEFVRHRTGGYGRISHPTHRRCRHRPGQQDSGEPSGLRALPGHPSGVPGVHGL